LRDGTKLKTPYPPKPEEYSLKVSVPLIIQEHASENELLDVRQRLSVGESSLVTNPDPATLSSPHTLTIRRTGGEYIPHRHLLLMDGFLSILKQARSPHADHVHTTEFPIRYKDSYEYFCTIGSIVSHYVRSIDYACDFKSLSASPLDHLWDLYKVLRTLKRQITMRSRSLSKRFLLWYTKVMMTYVRALISMRSKFLPLNIWREYAIWQFNWDRTKDFNLNEVFGPEERLSDLPYLKASKSA